MWLRPVQTTDVTVFCEQHSDPDAAYMAAFTAIDSGDPDACEQRWRQILENVAITAYTVQHHGAVAGYVLAYPWAETLEVSYWLGRRFWGQGIATEAVRQLVTLVAVRPLSAHVAHDNVGSLRVLEKCGFAVTASGSAYSPVRRREVDEFVLGLGV